VTAHPAALVLADHVFVGNPNRSYPGRCSCWLDNPETGWRGAACDHPEHQTEMLAAAGLLAEVTEAAS
jgi:hypothetical protein